MTTPPTPDPLTALAAELGRIGQRLDGMGVELMTLRDGMGAAGAASPPEGRTVTLRGEGGATPGHGGPTQGGPTADRWGDPAAGGWGDPPAGHWGGPPAGRWGSPPVAGGRAPSTAPTDEPSPMWPAGPPAA